MTLAQDLVAPTGCNSTTSPICWQSWQWMRRLQAAKQNSFSNQLFCIARRHLNCTQRFHWWLEIYDPF
jgi:hypothetical protein